jgi:hypothetical protein
MADQLLLKQGEKAGHMRGVGAFLRIGVGIAVASCSGRTDSTSASADWDAGPVDQPDAAPCVPLGAVTLTMLPPSGTHPPHCIYSGTTTPLGPSWFQIQTTTGQTIPTSTACASACSSSCDVGGCVQGVQAVTVGPSGISGQWDGRIHPPSMCTSQFVQVSCFETACAPAGHYVARMCAFECDNAGIAFCTQGEFDYPGTPPLTGTLP